jgi:carbonic anhydrase
MNKFIAALLATALLAVGCGSGQENTQKDEAPAEKTQAEPEGEAEGSEEAAPKQELRLAVQSDVLTQEEQAALKPDEVIKMLEEGNARFVDGTVTVRDHSAQIRKTAQGQFPKAAVLSCVDSRVPVEDVFDRGIGDVFVARVAGNFENTDIIGSMEFATKVAGSKVILVLGHERCGAVKGAIDDVKLGNLTATLSNIKPAIEALSDYEGEKTSSNPEFVHLVAEENVRLTVADILTKSEVIKEMVDKGELKVVGAMYDLDTGKVTMVKPRS